MPLIKSTSSAAAQAKPFNMGDIEAHARRMLLKARQDADQLLAAAQAEAEKIKAAAHIEGLASGKKEGLAQGKAEGLKQGKAEAFEKESKQLSELLTLMQQAMQQLNDQQQELMNRSEAEVLPLALAIAEKVTRRMGTLDPRVVEANAREAVRLVLSRHDIRIAANPGRLKQQWPQLERITIIEDPSITPGGCRVTTAGGEIDADLQSQLDRIARELVPEIAHEGVSG
jgi:flagellar assembly protein FliH